MKTQTLLKEHVNVTIILLAILVAIGFITLAHIMRDPIWRNVFTSAGAGSLTIIPTILIVDGVRRKSLELRLTDNQRRSLRRVQHAHFTLVAKLILDLGDDISTEEESRKAIAEALTTPGTVSKKYWYIALKAILSTDAAAVKKNINSERLQDIYLPAFLTIVDKLEATLMHHPDYEDLGGTSKALYDLVVKAEEVIGMIESIDISSQLYSEGEMSLKARQAHSQEVINSLLEYLQSYRNITNQKEL